MIGSYYTSQADPVNRHLRSAWVYLEIIRCKEATVTLIPQEDVSRPGLFLVIWMAIRPKTLLVSMTPVIVGTAVAFHSGRFAAGPALAALIGAVCLQIGANFSNDVFDFQKGADTHQRLGPVRVTQAGTSRGAPFTSTTHRKQDP